jgi:3-oxoacyl-[acyl-carrier protein] reductase
MCGRLESKVAIVTGSAGGIGRSIAILFATEGAKVLVVDVNSTGSRETVRQIRNQGGEASFLRADMSKRKDVEKMAAVAKERYGAIHILCQNAAIFLPTLLEDMKEEVWDKVVSVNMKGAFLTVKACLPIMKAQNYGSIVLTSSITGPRVGCPTLAHYGATKAAIEGFMRTAAVELAKYNITINAVEPGEILTEKMEEVNGEEGVKTLMESIPLRRLGEPKEVAYATLFLASDEARYITGQSIVVDGGILLPEAKMSFS